jgi:hypothetical protein
MDALEKGKSDLGQVLENLDKCSCLFVEYYEEILNQRKLLDSVMNDAYLNLSKARSILGCSNLSILQVPNQDLSAKLKIEIKQSNDDDEDLIEKLDGLSIDLIHSEKTSQEENNKTTKLPDWFGVLTPMSLKLSHKAFHRSLYLVKSICELQMKIQNLEKIYFDLIKQKQKLSLSVGE